MTEDVPVACALQAVEFQLIRNAEEISTPCDTFKFHPLMAHQIFGDSEKIFGYVDLKVCIMFAAASFEMYMGLKFTECVEAITEEGPRSDNVGATISASLPDGVQFLTMSSFLDCLGREKAFRPFGEKLYEHKDINDDGEERIFEYYICHNTTPDFIAYFSRVEMLVLWFIDAASYIDTDDPQWKYFMCYEKYKDQNGEYMYQTVGFATVYEYYAYPEHIRPRISQVLVLPPFQRIGVGMGFITTIYNHYQKHGSVIDITAEDPSDQFRRLKDVYDCKMCVKLDCFNETNILKGFTKEMVQQARTSCKINPKQCRRIYEILRLLHMNLLNPEEQKKYRLEIKSRLNNLNFRQVADIQRLEKMNIDASFLKNNLPPKQDRMLQLQKDYETLLDEYMNIIHKLKTNT